MASVNTLCSSENIEFSGFYEGSCTHKIEMKSLYGCALTDLYLLKKMFNKYWYIFAFLFIGFGAFLCFYGHKIFWLTAISVTGLICCFLISIFVLNLIPSLIKTEKSLWILLCVGLLVGIIIGITIKKRQNYLQLCWVLQWDILFHYLFIK